MTDVRDQVSICVYSFKIKITVIDYNPLVIVYPVTGWLIEVYRSGKPRGTVRLRDAT